VAREQSTVKFAPTVIETFEKGLSNAVKIVGVSDDHDLVARCEKDAQASLGHGCIGGTLATLLPRHNASRCE
jgi:hypothetical protein